MTPEQLKSLRRMLSNFDHCCWSHGEHYQVIEEIEKLEAKLALAEQQLREANELAENRLNWQVELSSIVAKRNEENATLRQSLEDAEAEIKLHKAAREETAGELLKEMQSMREQESRIETLTAAVASVTRVISICEAIYKAVVEVTPRKAEP